MCKGGEGEKPPQKIDKIPSTRGGSARSEGKVNLLLVPPLYYLSAGGSQMLCAVEMEMEGNGNPGDGNARRERRHIRGAEVVRFLV